jgi:hypothetical protein
VKAIEQAIQALSAKSYAASGNFARIQEEVRRALPPRLLGRSRRYRARNPRDEFRLCAEGRTSVGSASRPVGRRAGFPPVIARRFIEGV